MAAIEPSLGMLPIPGGSVLLGSDQHYPEERPRRRMELQPFLLAAHPVTVGQFARFVAATGWRSQAERAGFGMVFRPTPGPVSLHDPAQWWHAVAGADWRHPFGPEAASAAQDCPVTQIAQADAEAYAAWAGGRLPSEWEWEAAARGGLEGAIYCWGEEFSPNGQLMAHIWTGMFPYYFARGSIGPVPVGQYPANGFGLFDMAGNVWERTASFYSGKPCCGPGNAGQGALTSLRGGSFLCAAEYCLRYRPAARIGVPPEETTCHIGFRLAGDAR